MLKLEGFSERDISSHFQGTSLKAQLLALMQERRTGVHLSDGIDG